MLTVLARTREGPMSYPLDDGVHDLAEDDGPVRPGNAWQLHDVVVQKPSQMIDVADIE